MADWSQPLFQRRAQDMDALMNLHPMRKFAEVWNRLQKLDEMGPLTKYNWFPTVEIGRGAINPKVRSGPPPPHPMYHTLKNRHSPSDINRRSP